jgi:hypothetical protein
VHRRRRSHCDGGGAGLTKSVEKLAEAEIERRLPVWCALSDLFLDNWFDPPYYEKIAATLRASGYTRKELRSIFFDEVTPGFAFNLLSIAGEWAGWDAQFVRDQMIVTLGKGSGVQRWLGRWLFRTYATKEWAKLEPLIVKSA